MIIRIASKKDSEDIQDIYLSAFTGNENEIVAGLAINLLSEETNPPIISLLAEYDQQVVGHVSYSPVTADDNESWQAYILAPIAVKPEYQKRHIGSELINHGIKELTEKGVHTLLVYGDPKYYSRFGFDVDMAADYIAPYDLKHPHGWQAMTLNECSLAKAPVKISCVNALRNSDIW